MSDPEQKLLAGIRDDARQEAEAIIEKARIAAERRRDAATQQVERITKEAEDQLRGRIEIIQRNCDSNIGVATRRISLQMRNELLQTVTDSVQVELNNMVKLSEYRRVLSGWIVEAVLGLGAVSEALVNASASELPLIDSKLLREAEGEVKEICGRSVTLKKSDGAPLSAQGVVITSQDGRVAFNNQVRTRLLRRQTEISRLIHNLDNSSNSKLGAG